MPCATRILLAMALTVATGACGETEPGERVLYRGLVAGSGYLPATITIVTTGEIAEAQITELDRTAYPLVGTYESGEVRLDSPPIPGTRIYSLIGGYESADGWLQGIMAGGGRFFAVQYEEGARPVTYCVFASRSGGGMSEITHFNLVARAGGRVDGLALESGAFMRLVGERSGNTIGLRFAEAWNQRAAGDPFGSLTVNGVSVAGTYDTGQTTGPLTGSECD